MKRALVLVLVLVIVGAAAARWWLVAPPSSLVPPSRLAAIRAGKTLHGTLIDRATGAPITSARAMLTTRSHDHAMGFYAPMESEGGRFSFRDTAGCDEFAVTIDAGDGYPTLLVGSDGFDVDVRGELAAVFTLSRSR